MSKDISQYGCINITNYKEKIKDNMTINKSKALC